jgi:release factor glutamine methyltransferase
MTSARQLFDYLTDRITQYPSKEKQAIVHILLNHFLRLSNIDVLVDRSIPEDSVHPDWEKIINRLNENEPVQHIIGSEEFCGMKFAVSSSVLIPRPETEELVRLITQDYAESEEKVRVLDIGTGSGCIAIVIARFLPDAEVYGWDVSENALTVAKENAYRLMANVTFELRDILAPENSESLSGRQFDCIVSNPPYVTYSEAEQMQPNVLRFEPHEALFVEDNSPLVFYQAIAEFGKKNLKSGGRCYVEINEHFGPETTRVFVDNGYTNVSLLKDIHGKNRFIRADRS